MTLTGPHDRAGPRARLRDGGVFARHPAPGKWGPHRGERAIPIQPAVRVRCLPSRRAEASGRPEAVVQHEASCQGEGRDPHTERWGGEPRNDIPVPMGNAAYVRSRVRRAL